MTTFLFIAAAVSFICGIITGFLSGSAATFAVSVISSAVLSALLIAVAQILENQGEIKEQMTFKANHNLFICSLEDNEED